MRLLATRAVNARDRVGRPEAARSGAWWRVPAAHDRASAGGGGAGGGGHVVIGCQFLSRVRPERPSKMAKVLGFSSNGPRVKFIVRGPIELALPKRNDSQVPRAARQRSSTACLWGSLPYSQAVEELVQKLLGNTP